MPDPEHITVYDERGRKQRLPRAEWAEQVLPVQLRAAWDDPDALYGVAARALADGFAERLAGAAARLGELEPGSERAFVLLAVVQLERGELEAAEATLVGFMRERGESASALTNLAKVYSAKGDAEGALELLLRAVRKDPNFETALLRLAAERRERGGEADFYEVLEAAAALEGSWRPQLWLARRSLRRGDSEEALELYREALPRAAAAAGADALTMASGDLGNAGLLAEALALVEPLYDPQRHGPYPGMNLVRAHLASGGTAAARALLDRLQALDFPPAAEDLARLERDVVEAGLPRSFATPVAISLLVLTEPLWTRGMRDPKWILPRRSGEGRRIGIFSFADTTRGGGDEAAFVELANDQGRLSRGLPLYLAESLLYKTDARASCVLAVISGEKGGPVVAGQPWDMAALVEKAPGLELPEVLVNGWFAREGAVGWLHLELFETATRKPLEHLRLAASGDFHGTALEAETRLFEALAGRGLARPAEPGFYASPPPAWQDAHVSALAQLLDQVLVANDLGDRSGLWNERGMLEYYFNLAEELPGQSVPPLIAACGVLASLAYGSPVGQRYKGALMRLCADRGSQSPIGRLAPYLLLRLGDEEAAVRERGRLLAEAEGPYRDWLAKVG